jgi:phage terminase small subunit
MADKLSAQAPKGLSLGARRRWAEQVRALDELGLATPARLELAGAWATALDGRDHAVAV